MLPKLWNISSQSGVQRSFSFIPDKSSETVLSEPSPATPTNVGIQSRQPSSVAPVGGELQSSPMVAEVPLSNGCVSQHVVLSSTNAQSSIVGSQSAPPCSMVQSRSVQEPIVYRHKSKAFCGQQQRIVDDSTLQLVQDVSVDLVPDPANLVSDPEKKLGIL
ncbi:hypothetical protein V6N11_007489 [Hibiscus sabdariffa]|uniref:Uncharacterized protein n=1 Tax=Hibiscus sabdariffa TaxID=183260 RepID=A0ABR2NSA5_9ROSI